MFSFRPLQVSLAAVAFAAVGVPTHGAVIVADLADTAVLANGTIPAGDSGPDHWNVRVGELFGGGTAMVIPFELPTLPEGQHFGSAEFRVLLFDKVGSPQYNVDLYGLPSRTAPDAFGSDYYAGATFDPAATLIQAAFLTPATVSGGGTVPQSGAHVTTTAAGGDAMLAYLNAEYAGGAGASQFVFLRLSIAGDAPEGNVAYTLMASNAGETWSHPVINYTIAPIPEPASAALLAAGAALLFTRRR
jgi:hypothetical protein